MFFAIIFERFWTAGFHFHLFTSHHSLRITLWLFSIAIYLFSVISPGSIMPTLIPPFLLTAFASKLLWAQPIPPSVSDSYFLTFECFTPTGSVSFIIFACRSRRRLWIAHRPQVWKLFIITAAAFPKAELKVFWSPRLIIFKDVFGAFVPYHRHALKLYAMPGFPNSP